MERYLSLSGSIWGGAYPQSPRKADDHGVVRRRRGSVPGPFPELTPFDIRRPGRLTLHHRDMVFARVVGRKTVDPAVPQQRRPACLRPRLETCDARKAGELSASLRIDPVLSQCADNSI